MSAEKYPSSQIRIIGRLGSGHGALAMFAAGAVAAEERVVWVTGRPDHAREFLSDRVEVAATIDDVKDSAELQPADIALVIVDDTGDRDVAFRLVPRRILFIEQP